MTIRELLHNIGALRVRANAEAQSGESKPAPAVCAAIQRHFGGEELDEVAILIEPMDESQPYILGMEYSPFGARKYVCRHLRAPIRTARK